MVQPSHLPHTGSIEATVAARNANDTSRAGGRSTCDWARLLAQAIELVPFAPNSVRQAGQNIFVLG